MPISEDTPLESAVTRLRAQGLFIVDSSHIEGRKVMNMPGARPWHVALATTGHRDTFHGYGTTFAAAVEQARLQHSHWSARQARS